MVTIILSLFLLTSNAAVAEACPSFQGVFRMRVSHDCTRVNDGYSDLNRSYWQLSEPIVGGLATKTIYLYPEADYVVHIEQRDCTDLRLNSSDWVPVSPLAPLGQDRKGMGAAYGRDKVIFSASYRVARGHKRESWELQWLEDGRLAYRYEDNFGHDFNCVLQGVL